MKTPFLAWGTWAWGGRETFGQTYDPEDLYGTFLQAAKEARETLPLWDTAYVYGSGQAEDTLGACIRRHKGRDCEVMGKITPGHLEADQEDILPLGQNSLYDRVRVSLKSSLERLGLPSFFMIWLHHAIEIRDYLSALNRCCKEGLLQSMGVSNHDLSQVLEAVRVAKDCGMTLGGVQNHFSLVYRFSEEDRILDYCKDHGIPFYAYMVLAQGLLTDRYNRDRPLPEGSGRARNGMPQVEAFDCLKDRMRPMFEALGLSIAQGMIAYAATKGAIPIIGVTSPGQVREAYKAAALTLGPEEVRQLEEWTKDLRIRTRRMWERLMAGQEG